MVPEKDKAHQPPAYANRRTGPETGAVERWLRLDLAARFESTISEPLPEDLVVLAARLFH
jgi:hypothetical protein